MIAAARRAFDWHRPLMGVAALMLLCAMVSLVGIVADPREILGAPAWAKPLKFSVSILVYAVTWAWLIDQLPRWRRAAHVLGTIIAVSLGVEQVLIVWAAATGTTSHFNVSNGAHTAVWATMAAAITVMYLCTFATSAALFLLRLPSAAATLAVRAGAIIALIGIGVAFLMTGPTADQLEHPAGIAGAHAVGVADGGPGLPLLGWSTEGGDYRVAHFVGMHALQALPLAALALAAVARRVPRLASSSSQTRLVAVLGVGYGASVLLLTVQAAIGQSVVHPSGAIQLLGCAIALGVAAAAAWVIARTPAERPRAAPQVVDAR